MIQALLPFLLASPGPAGAISAHLQHSRAGVVTGGAATTGTEPCRPGAAASNHSSSASTKGFVGGGNNWRSRTYTVSPEAAFFIYYRQPDGSWQQREARGGSILRFWRYMAGIEPESKGVIVPLGQPAVLPTTVESGRGVAAAPPGQIALVFVVLFCPVASAWILMNHCGILEKHYATLLPVTLVVFLIGFDTANQSLSALTLSPLTNSAVHAFSLWVTMAVWMLVVNFREIMEMDWRVLKSWLVVATFFTAYQMINHLVSYFCSLSERTIFLNLCPVVSLMLELAVMPKEFQPKATWAMKLSLQLVAVGAVLFTVEKADFTREGILVASAFVCVLIPYRICQRWAMKSQVQHVPVSVLATLDGLFLFAPSAIAVVRDAGVSLRISFSAPSAILLNFLTAVCFIGVHVCGILMARICTATSYLVFSNMANFVLVGMSFCLFDEDIFQSSLMVTGLVMSLFSGVWYSSQVSGGSDDKGQQRAASGGASNLLESAK